MKVVSKQNNSKMCVICGINNPFGVKAEFYNMEDNSVMTVFMFKEEHQSYPGRVHGGMISTMLDEIIGRALWIKEPKQYGVTMSLNIKYRKVVPYNAKLKAVGRVIKESDQFFEGEGKIMDMNGNVLAEGVAHYIKLPLDTIGSINSEDVNVMLKDDVKNID